MTTHEPKVYGKIFATLLLLLGLTWGIGYIDLGPFNLIVALTIAIAKALLVVMFFMHIKGSNRLLHLAAGAGLLWLLILLALTFADYTTRQ